MSAKERVAREIVTMLLGPAGYSGAIESEIVRALGRRENTTALLAEELTDVEKRVLSGAISRGIERAHERYGDQAGPWLESNVPTLRTLAELCEEESYDD